MRLHELLEERVKENTKRNMRLINLIHSSTSDKVAKAIDDKSKAYPEKYKDIAKKFDVSVDFVESLIPGSNFKSAEHLLTVRRKNYPK